MFIFQVAMVVFAFFMLYVLRIHFRKQHIGPSEFGAWVGIWFVMIGASLFPSSLRGVADILRIERVFDLLVIGAFAVISTVLVFTRLGLQEQKRKLEEVVRHLAWQESEKAESEPFA